MTDVGFMGWGSRRVKIPYLSEILKENQVFGQSCQILEKDRGGMPGGWGVAKMANERVWMGF